MVISAIYLCLQIGGFYLPFILCKIDNAENLMFCRSSYLILYLDVWVHHEKEKKIIIELLIDH